MSHGCEVCRDSLEQIPATPLIEIYPPPLENYSATSWKGDERLDGVSLSRTWNASLASSFISFGDLFGMSATSPLLSWAKDTLISDSQCLCGSLVDFLGGTTPHRPPPSLILCELSSSLLLLSTSKSLILSLLSASPLNLGMLALLLLHPPFPERAEISKQHKEQGPSYQYWSLIQGQ